MKITFDLTIPDDFINNLVTKEWLEKTIKEQLGDNGYLILTPEQVGTIDPTIKCKSGPEIKTIKVLNSQSLIVNFYGVDVTEIEYTLYKDNIEIEKGILSPTNDIPTIVLKV